MSTILYFPSKDIRVFPCTYRGNFTKSNGSITSFDPEARLITETNYTHIAGVTAALDSYILELDTTDTLKCVIGGYYFEIANISKSLKDSFGSDSLTNAICLAIRLRNTEISSAYEIGDSEIESTRSTKHLVAVEAGNHALDQNISENGYDYRFGGLIATNYTETDLIEALELNGLGDDVIKTITIYNKSVKINSTTYNKAAVLPEIYHGIQVNSHSIGNKAKTSTADQVAIGRFNKGNSSTLFEIGNGTSAGSTSNAFEVDTAGNTTAAGKINNATIDGTNINGAIISGNNNSVDSGVVGATVTGSGNKVIVDYGHAEGYQTQVGYKETGDGEYGIAAHSEGYKTIAAADYSHAAGKFTTTHRYNTNAPTVIGIANRAETETLFEIGNGALGTDRPISYSNAVEVTHNDTRILTDLIQPSSNVIKNDYAAGDVNEITFTSEYEGAGIYYSRKLATSNSEIESFDVWDDYTSDYWYTLSANHPIFPITITVTSITCDTKSLTKADSPIIYKTYIISSMDDLEDAEKGYLLSTSFLRGESSDSGNTITIYLKQFDNSKAVLGLAVCITTTTTSTPYYCTLGITSATQTTDFSSVQLAKGSAGNLATTYIKTILPETASEAPGFTGTKEVTIKDLYTETHKSNSDMFYLPVEDCRSNASSKINRAAIKLVDPGYVLTTGDEEKIVLVVSNS